MQNINFCLLIVIIIIILLIFTLLFFCNKKRERYQPNEDDENIYQIIQTVPKIGGQPDEHFLYIIFPRLSIADLVNFSRISPEGERLVRKYLRSIGIRLNPYVLNDLIFFVESYRENYKIESEILMNIFNTISPNSSKFLTIREEPVLALNKTLFPNIIADRKNLKKFIRTEITPNTNLKFFLELDPRPNQKVFVRFIHIFIRNNTNEEIENRLLQIGREIELTFDPFTNIGDLDVTTTVEFVDANNRLDETIDFIGLGVEDEENFRAAKDRNIGIVISFYLPDLRIFAKNSGFNQIIPPRINVEEVEEE